ncbi:chemotaxis protein CheW [Bacillus sp. TS-2]|nr:chemotaxis protein CheW [Bacillus sp. TS-2]
MSVSVGSINDVKVIIFQIQSEEYAIPVEFIQSIERMQPITRIPGTEPYIKGVMNLRGLITPIVDLRARFSLEEREFDDSTRILVISKDTMSFGMIVDGANDVLDLPKDKIEPTPEVVGGVQAEYLDGVIKIGERLFTLLNLSKIMETK